MLSGHGAGYEARLSDAKAPGQRSCSGWGGAPGCFRGAGTAFHRRPYRHEWRTLVVCIVRQFRSMPQVVKQPALTAERPSWAVPGCPVNRRACKEFKQLKTEQLQQLISEARCCYGTRRRVPTLALPRCRQAAKEHQYYAIRMCAATATVFLAV